MDGQGRGRSHSGAGYWRGGRWWRRRCTCRLEPLIGGVSSSPSLTTKTFCPGRRGPDVSSADSARSLRVLRFEPRSTVPARCPRSPCPAPTSGGRVRGAGVRRSCECYYVRVGAPRRHTSVPKAIASAYPCACASILISAAFA